MKLFPASSSLDQRWRVSQGSLNPLAESLAADFRRVIERPLYIPEQKALLSREGGRCRNDGAMLDFDPFSPQEHVCPRCSARYDGDLHHRWWIYWYQLWLAERAIHGAMLGRLSIVPEGVEFARRILDGYADRYLAWPNVDNALGPTRPFFSTYIESIWLLQLCVALDVMEDYREGAEGGRFRDQVIEPSRRLISSYDEGLSNRQVWNNAALMAASRLLGRDDEAEATVWASSGLVTHLSEAMLPDGTWYEGENYHLFAHRGLWYCVNIAERIGAGVDEALIDRFDRGFVTPFLTSLPDLTFPSRRDSQYAISLRQWRFAEMCELGLARKADPTLSTMLRRLYDGNAPSGDTARWKSAAEAERNVPPVALTPADLGWKSFLCARETAVATEPASLPSVLLDSQGIGVIRRNAGRVYIGLDYGVSGGGHGHPDRLNLLVSNGDERILDDMGTGSYVDPSLHWYRSTLAHNAPMFGGRSQARVNGTLTAYEDRGGAGWIAAEAYLGMGKAIRTIVAMPDYLLDEVSWEGSVTPFDLPIHVDGDVDASLNAAATIDGSSGLEDGFRFLDQCRLIAECSADQHLVMRRSGLRLWLAADVPWRLYRAVAPGAPGRPPQAFHLFRSGSERGTLRVMIPWEGAVHDAVLFPTPTITTEEATHEHRKVEHGWQVAITVGSARSTIDLEGIVPDPYEHFEGVDHVQMRMLNLRQTFRQTLGRQAYRRSEETWDEAGQPTAFVTIDRTSGGISLEIDVQNADRSFADPDAVNRLDNEPADINGAGLQLYLGAGSERAGYMLVPEPGTEVVRKRSIDGWGAGIPITASWRSTETGWRIHIEVFTRETGIALDYIINEKPFGRERRRGQLVGSGGEGEFVYLRGDRHDPDRLMTLSSWD